jgi:hypothetical protein
MSNSELFAEIGRLNVLLNEKDKEIERLKGLMPPDERGPGFVGQGSWSVFAEKVVAERDARNQRNLDRIFDDLMEDDEETCEHGNTECKRCGVGQPTRDPRQDLKVGVMVRFERTGVITARQSAGIVKDYDGNDYEPIQYEIKDRDKRITNYVPYHQILAVIGEEEE